MGIITVAILFYGTIAAKTLNTTEEKINQFVDANKKAQLLLLETLVNINSGTDNIPGVMAVGNKLKSQFEQLGFKTDWVNLPKDMHRAATLIASRKGSQGKRLLLIGHLDTVFPKKSSFNRFQSKENIAKGPGVMDMKGGDLVILYALKALNSVDALDNVTITVVLTGDEEDSGKPTSISRKPLFDVAKKSDIALDFEASLLPNSATVARRGVIDWHIETTGPSVHSAAIFSDSAGKGAVFELTRILNSIQAKMSQEKYFTFNPGLLAGGMIVSYDSHNTTMKAHGKDNVIPSKTIARGDMRYISQAQLKAAQKSIEAIIANHYPLTKSSIKYEGGIPSMPPSPQNYELLKQYSQISEDLGNGKIEALDPGLRGAGDISHVAELVSASLAGLGPLGTGAHSIKEQMDIASLVTQTKLAALLIYRLTR